MRIRLDVFVGAPTAYILRWGIPLFCILFGSGCGNADRATVSGRVSVQGRPLAEGVVTFRPGLKTPGPEFSGDITGGEYHVEKDVLPGQYTVEVRSWKKTGRIVKSPFGTDTEEIVNAIPERYWGPQTELSVELQPGSNRADFELYP